MISYRELLLYGEDLLRQQKIDDAKTDAWLLMEYVFHLNKSEYLLSSEKEAPITLVNEYMQLIARRATHIPTQHLIGSQEFMGLPFIVNQHVLIPRQDTEVLVEQAIKVCQSMETQPISILDMCTGSGCIAISLSKQLQNARVVGADISEEALKIARKNALENVESVEFVKSDLFACIEDLYSVIVSNPPYIPTEEINELMEEVREYEPVQALDGGKDGMDFYRIIIEDAKKHLMKNGYIILEIGYNQADMVTELLTYHRYKNIKVVKDLSGLDRVVVAQEDFIKDLEA